MRVLREKVEGSFGDMRGKHKNRGKAISEETKQKVSYVEYFSTCFKKAFH